jgi:hypothetical protein
MPNMMAAGAILRSMEQRRSSRIDVGELVYVNTVAGSTFLLNLSTVGMAVQTMSVLPPGESVDFAFELPEAKSEVRGVAKVVWSDNSGRAGLAFDLVPHLHRRRLQDWLTSRSSRGPRPISALS